MQLPTRHFLPACIIGAVLSIAVAGSVGFAREFTVQVLSSSDPAAAEKAKEALRKDGLDAYVEQPEGAAGACRVRIGRFASRTDAEQVQEQLRAQGLDSWIAFAEPAGPAREQAPPAVNDGPETATSRPEEAAEPRAALPAPEPATAQPAHNAAQPAPQVGGQAPPAGDAGAEGAQPAPPALPPSEPAAVQPALDAAQPAAQVGGQAPPAGDAGAEGAQPASPALPPSEPAAAQPALDEDRPAAETKMFELVINPVPTFTDEQAAPAAAATPATTTAPPCRPDTHYAYYDPQDATLHITTAEPLIPGLRRKLLRSIIIFPARFRQLNLHELSLHVAIEEKPAAIALDGVTRPQTMPARQAVLDFESVLREQPLRILYYPQRTEPDGTLHGAVFFKNGASVEQEMVRLGLAAVESGQLFP